MTALMEKAIKETAKLSDEEQDLVASLVLDTIRDTRRWDAQFARTKDVLEELYDEAMEEYNAGKTTPINS